ncbi:helix-turn-helix domain-containing protein [Streptomyces sp. CoH27]|uniref:helix-turn-helix domain-containing protein n=1 Tax=Streptomyces sp. CoH27 TaxID=2875763 RepID=UPI001CD39185|nr:helix-turn-helix domain-containing protein [Streptomyces sp. CoH27]
MAEKKPNAVLRPNQGVRRSTTHSGVTHVRTYQSGHYTVVGNHLAQHRELSLTAIGLATHILSLPEGAPVDIRSLADRFPEGRDRIAFALRELEAHGYLERVRERTESGRLFTRTYAHHTPAGSAPRTVPVREGGSVTSAEAPGTSQEDDQAPVASVAPVESDAPASSEKEHSSEPTPGERHSDRAVTLLASLRRTDNRLTLSQRQVNQLAPAVEAWFAGGATAAVVHRVLTADLPVDMRHPAGVLACRLSELLPSPLPARPSAAAAHTEITRHRTHPFQTCDGCERAFRAPHPGRCRDCRTDPLAAGRRACVA